jgi:hypothetical protein
MMRVDLNRRPYQPRIDRRAERGLGPRYALCLDLRD